MHHHSQEKSNPRPSRAVAYDASQLFSGGREVRIHFGRDEYRLQITRNEKLILTK
ncbi:MAG: hemin uptake protein HemP [Phycisphaerales bacterium]|jgi:hemin uptake protein HemP|nr:hemin uptake protein HemP [Phycisphaerales bacterium]MBT7171793.1 hemin uptake protein HemP [Phycisphaerales bacterium]